MPSPCASTDIATAPDPRVEQLVRSIMFVAIAMVLLLPDARAHGPLGWAPLWLLGMPGVAWWALHRFRLPRQNSSPMPLRRPGRRRASAQARRRGAVVWARPLTRAA